MNKGSMTSRTEKVVGGGSQPPTSKSQLEAYLMTNDDENRISPELSQVIKAVGIVGIVGVRSIYKPQEMNTKRFQACVENLKKNENFLFWILQEVLNVFVPEHPWINRKRAYDEASQLIAEATNPMKVQETVQESVEVVIA